MLNKLKQNKVELTILAILLGISGLLHGYNMFNFPPYFDDEGTYMSQAWSFIKEGSLSPYTYWYDHPPVGWMQIGLWGLLTGGFHVFGTAINSGRVFMFLLGILSVLLVYKIARSLGCNSYASFLSAFVYGISPLGISLRRMVLLDNLLVFWLLLSISLILHKPKRLKFIILSSIAFGLAVLSKEVGIIFLPVLAYLISFESHRHHWRFALVKWVSIVLLIGSVWFLYALLKGELFPMGSLFDAGGKHVSLIQTIQYQLSRGGEGNIFTYPSDFWNSANKWVHGNFALLVGGVGDKILIIGGAVSLLLNLIRAIKDRYARFVVAATIIFIFFLGKGTMVLEFYVIPLLPFLALNVALTFDSITLITHKLLKNGLLAKSVGIGFTVLIIGIAIYSNKTPISNLLSNKPVQAQTLAIDWVSHNIDKNAFILTDDYAYLDLRQKGFDFPNPIYYWKAELDPSVRKAILHDDWRNIRYIVVTPSVQADLKTLPFIREAYNNSTPLKSFTSNGYTVTIVEVNNIKKSFATSWGWYKSNLIDNNGRVKELESEKTTSEAQAYALFRAVWMNDRKEFDKVWRWTFENMELKDKNLFAWLYGQKEKSTELGIRDKGTATDADQDIALALLFAYKEWGDTHYLDQAKNIINDIWKYETVEIKEKRYIVAGDWASLKGNKIYTINPSYLSPYAYRIFSEVDTNHDWINLVDTSYQILRDCSESTFNSDSSTNIPPDWCGLDKNGEIIIASTISDKSSDYSYDAIRTLWRVALDYQWNKESRALSFLQKMDIWSREWTEKQKIFISYSHDGKAIEKAESLAHYGTQMAFFSVVNPDIAEQVYKQKVLSQWNKDGFWGDKNNYYDQNWVWFGTAMYTNNLPNLWKMN